MRGLPEPPPPPPSLSEDAPLKQIFEVIARQAVAARPSGIANESEIVHIRVRHLVKSDHNAQLALFKSEADALRAVPGVKSVAFANQIPLSNNGSTTGVAANRKQTRSTADVSLYNSGMASRRCSHRSFQASPTNSGSGTAALKLSMVAAQPKFSISRLPPL